MKETFLDIDYDTDNQIIGKFRKNYSNFNFDPHFDVYYKAQQKIT